MLKVSLPKKPKYSKLNENLGKIEIEACYPGFGTTIGNTLRRILLSSLTGAAVTSIKIKGISHEFSTIPGVKEDLIQIILNLKKVRFKVHKDEPVKLTLKEKGVKKITAAQIQCPADVEVVTKNAPIATLTEKKSEIEMEIETDGSISPREAYQKAIEIITEQFELIKNFQADKKEEEKKTGVLSGEGTKEKDAGAQEPAGELGDDKLGATVDSLSFSTRTMNVLEKNNIKIVRDLASLTEEELSKLEGMGEKGRKEITKAIGNFDLKL